MKKVVILGAGGFGREAFSLLRLMKNYRVVGFIDSDSSLKSKLIDGIPILGNDSVLNDLIRNEVNCAFVAIGNSKIRENLFRKICKLNFEAISILHPSAIIVPDASIGKGVIVYPNVTIGTGVNIKDSVLINSNVSIGHDVEIGSFVNINPGTNIAGRVKIGQSAFLGIGCSVLENIIIGSSAVIGGGALVRKNVASGTTVIGVPARAINPKSIL